MRRLDGVTHVSLNTVDQEALVYLADPVEVDFFEVSEAADSAAFLVKSITLHARGEVLEGPCAACDGRHSQLRIEGSGQLFHLLGETAPWEETRSFSASVEDWEAVPARLKLVAKRTPAPQS